MHSFLGHLEYVLIYMNGILIFSENREQHYVHLDLVFEILLKEDVVFKKRKCQFLKSEIKFLKCMLGHEELTPNPKKVEDVLRMPTPTNKQQLRNVIGALGFFRRFIPRLATLLAPLTDLTSAKKVFHFSDECRSILHTALFLLAQETLLYYPDFTQLFEL